MNEENKIKFNGGLKTTPLPDFLSKMRLRDITPKENDEEKKNEEIAEQIPNNIYNGMSYSVPQFNGFNVNNFNIARPEIPVQQPEQQVEIIRRQQEEANRTAFNQSSRLDINQFTGNCSITIDVPYGVRYLSEWGEFKLSNFPEKCIINKQIPGCGMTEYCLTCFEFVILCSPRKLLLQNKKDQHGNEVFLVKNEMESDMCVDIDLNNKKSSRSVAKAITKNDQNELERFNNQEIYKRIYSELNNYVGERRIRALPLKILVTYDSYHIVKDMLKRMRLFDKFFTVVDEFQSILHDARFKSTTELGFLRDLELDKPESRVLFVSATPILEDYIKMLDSFKNLPYYTLDWYKNDPTRVTRPDLEVNYMPSIISKASEIIKAYLDGNYDRVVVTKDNQSFEIFSTEAIFYVNSVNHILNIIDSNNLNPDQVNILCADTEDNRKRIRTKLGKGFSLGYIPTRGEQNKMFTFCTRTVYLGADFYSKCAKSFIFSDSNSDCLSVDISEDLPQILGRQRDSDNPWKNSANFFYRTTADYRRMTQEDFDNIVKKKEFNTKTLLKIYNNTVGDFDRELLAKTYQKANKNENYRTNYVSVDRIYLDSQNSSGKVETLKPVTNDLVKVNEIRSFRIQQIDYRDRFAMFSTIEDKFKVEYSNTNNEVGKAIADFFKVYDQFRTIYEKLKYLSEYSRCNPAENVNSILSQIADSDTVKSYFTSLGPDRLRELGYNVSKIKKELGIVTFSFDTLINSIYNNFHVGDKYTISDMKKAITNLYSSIGYDKAPKAIDILNYFEVREFSIHEKKPDGGRRQIKCYELLESFEDRIRLEMKMAK